MLNAPICCLRIKIRVYLNIVGYNLILWLWGRSVSTDRGRGYLQAERFTLRTKRNRNDNFTELAAA